MLYYIILYCIILYHIMLCYIILHHIRWYYVIIQFYIRHLPLYPSWLLIPSELLVYKKQLYEWVSCVVGLVSCLMIGVQGARVVTILAMWPVLWKSTRVSLIVMLLWRTGAPHAWRVWCWTDVSFLKQKSRPWQRSSSLTELSNNVLKLKP